MEVNDGELGDNDQLDVNIPINVIPEVAGSSRMAEKLPVANIVSKQADAAIPLIDEQGFQLVSSKSSRKEKKAGTQKSSK